VDQLVGTITRSRGTPDLAKFKSVRQPVDGGAREHTTIKSFYGAGQRTRPGPNPSFLEETSPGAARIERCTNAVEAVLHALSQCMTVSFIYPAAAQGINVESLEYTMEGDLDLHGFLHLSDRVRPGFQNIRVKAKVTADAPRRRFRSCCQ